MKQTALNWFLDQLPKSVQVSLINTSLDVVKKARYMEKEQIMDAFDEGILDEIIGEKTTPEQYYNETYDSTNHPRDTQSI